MSDLHDQLRAGLSGRYVLERELGRGGTATVYLAQDLRHERPVALKVLHSELAATLGPERFLREIKLAARLQHPHILSVYDSGETAGYLWFTMPYIGGESLRTRLNRDKQLPIDEALRIAREAAEALGYAHRQGTVHRDIKPDNILLSEGHAIVADFGIGRALGLTPVEQQLTGTGIVVGTPAYMSPEQAAGEREIDGRTDIYSLGVVLYEMLAGEPPFTGPTAQAVLAKRFTGEIPRVRRVRASVPESVERTILKALAPVPADRFQSASEFADALGAPADEDARPQARSAPRNRIALVLGLGFLLGLGVLFAWRRSYEKASRAAEPKRIAVLPFQNLNRTEDQYFADGITDEVRGKLAALPGVRVTARSSSDHYLNTAKSPQQIGRELGVQYLLTGTVSWDKGAGGQGRVRVSPELVQAGTGSTRWQQPFEAPLTDVFKVQADIAGRVAQALDVALGVGQKQQLAEKPTQDLAAYDLYLKGRYAWNHRTAEGLSQARDLFERAIKLDPRFARAYAGLADVYVVIPLWSDVPPDQAYPRAKAAALEALRLDSTLAEPHAALADVHTMYEWDWTSADRRFRQALALDPNNANTHHWYASDYLIAVGRMEEAVREERRAVELDPLSATFVASVGMNLYRARRYNEALSLFEEARSLDPDFILVNAGLGWVNLVQHKYAEAAKVLQRAVDPKVRHSVDLAFLGYAYAKAGRRPEALQLLKELEDRASRGYVSPANVAVLLSGLGDTVQTFKWLDRAVGEHDPFLIYNFVSDPLEEGLRRRPEGLALLKRMGLPAPPQ